MVGLLTRSKNLPDFEILQAHLRQSEPAIDLYDAFSIHDFIGFVPAILNDDECGFEYAVDPVDRELADELQLPASSDWDVFITLESRSSFIDAECAVLTAGALASLSGGVLVDEDGELVAQSKIDEWCTESAHAIHQAQRAQVERDKIQQSLKRRGDPSKIASSLLAKWRNEPATLQIILDRIMITSSQGTIFGSSWKVLVGQQSFDHTRYSKLRQQQLAIMMNADQSEKPTLEKQIAEIEAKLDDAGKLDEESVSKLEHEFQSLAETKIVSSASMDGSDIRITLSGNPPVSIEWYGSQESININTSGGQFMVQGGEIHIL